MSVRPWTLLLLLAPFLYVAALLLPAFPGDEVAVLAAFAVCGFAAALSASPYAPLRAARTAVLIVLVVVVVATAADPRLSTGVGDELLSGLFLGVPIIAAVVAWRSEESLGVRLTAFGFALTWGVVLLATREHLVNGGSAINGPAFTSTFYQVNASQVTGLIGLLNGSGFTVLPIHDLFDGVYASLIGLSVLGILLDLVRPQTGLERALPIAVRPSREKAVSRDLRRPYGFSAAQRAVFRERSPSEPSPTTWPPGLLAVAYGAGAASVFLLIATVASGWALLVGSAVALAVAVLLILASDRPRAVEWLPLPRRPRPRPPTTSEVFRDLFEGPAAGESSTDRPSPPAPDASVPPP